MSNEISSRWDAIREAASSRGSFALTLVGIAIALISYFVAKSETVPLWALMFILVATIWIIATLFFALKVFEQSGISSLPAIRATFEDGNNPENLILLLDPSDLFGIFSGVTIYHKDKQSGFEKLIGYGHVVNIQGDRKIQIVVEEWSEAGKAYFEPLKNHSPDTLACTLVRPTAPKPEKRLDMSPGEIDRIFLAARALIAQREDEVSDE